MKIVVLTFSFVLATSFFLMGQRTITGTIVEKDTGRPVRDAVVSSKSRSLETKTNDLGKFELTINSVDTLVVVSSGYSRLLTSVPSDARNLTLELVKEEVFYKMVDQSAVPPGGWVEFSEWLRSNTTYPNSAKKAGITGRVYVEFIINEDGSIDASSVRAIPSSEIKKEDAIHDPACVKEAIRVISASPNWRPARDRGKLVRQQMMYPVSFR